MQISFRIILFLAVFPLLLSSCALIMSGSGAVANARKSKKEAKKSDKIDVYKSTRDLKLSKTTLVHKITVDRSSSSSLGIDHYLKTGKITFSSRAHNEMDKIDYYHNSDRKQWVIWDETHERVIFFKTPQSKPSEFVVDSIKNIHCAAAKRRNARISKRKAKEIIASFTIAEQKRLAEEKRIADSIFKANTLEGKDVKDLKVVAIGHQAGPGRTLIMGLEATLADGTVLKTKSLGGQTPNDQMTIKTSFGQAVDGGVLLPSSTSAFEEDQFEVTLGSKYQPNFNQTQKVTLYYNISIAINAAGQNGSSGNSGSRPTYDKGEDGTDGKDGSDGGDGRDVEISLDSRSHTVTGETVYYGVIEGESYIIGNGSLIKVNASGGNGGKGGNGGDGADLYRCNNQVGTFYGRRGGNGGNGGRGGNGGTITYKRLNGVTIEAISEGGRGGDKGDKGDGGDDKECMDGGSRMRTISSGKSKNGREGRPGTPGQKGRINAR